SQPAIPSSSFTSNTVTSSTPAPTTNSKSRSLNLSGHRYDIRTGFLSPYEEQEVLEAISSVDKTLLTFNEALTAAVKRFEHILCLNLNRTHVDIPAYWFYTFLFAHPHLIIQNSHWFENNSVMDDQLFDESDSTTNQNLHVLKRQLVVLSKWYKKELNEKPIINNDNDDTSALQKVKRRRTPILQQQQQRYPPQVNGTGKRIKPESSTVYTIEDGDDDITVIPHV
ncbi:unnamed protein product, partial [Didymodactylos carnosus]